MGKAATTELNAEIVKAAEETVRLALQHLGKALDYSTNSLEDVEALIQYVKSRLSQLSKEGKSADQTAQSASISMGSYIGEVIRRQYGGTWVAKHDSTGVLVINGREISPIHYAYQRLTKDSEHSLRMYWSEISQEVTPFTPAKPETEPQAISEPEHKIREEPEKTDQPAEGRSNRTLIVRAGIAVLCLLVIGAIAISSRIRATNEANAKFNAAYNAFLLEGEKLSVMIKQGVTNQEFRTQFAEVNSRYSLIDDSWPASYRNAKGSFYLALKGWSLAKELIDYSDELHVNPDETLLGRAASYLGVSRDTVKSTSTTELADNVMEKASIYFEEGKAGVK